GVGLIAAVAPRCPYIARDVCDRLWRDRLDPVRGPAVPPEGGKLGVGKTVDKDLQPHGRRADFHLILLRKVRSDRLIRIRYDRVSDRALVAPRSPDESGPRRARERRGH